MRLSSFAAAILAASITSMVSIGSAQSQQPLTSEPMREMIEITMRQRAPAEALLVLLTAEVAVFGSWIENRAADKSVADPDYALAVSYHYLVLASIYGGLPEMTDLYRHKFNMWMELSGSKINQDQLAVRSSALSAIQDKISAKYASQPVANEANAQQYGKDMGNDIWRKGFRAAYDFAKEAQ